MASITINGQVFEAEENIPVLEAIRANGIRIPTLCYHPALKPSGSCKLCSVEVKGKSGRTVTMLSCILKVRDGLEVETESELVTKARTAAFMKLLRLAPHAKAIWALAEEFGLDLGSPPDDCIRCRLCIRVCKEVVGPGALHMEERAGVNYVVPAEGLCIGCGTCVNLCPTSAISQVDVNNTRTISIRDEIIGVHGLERCQVCGRQFATQRFLQQVESRMGDHPHAHDHHQYCPTCAKLMSDRVSSFSRARKL